MNKLFKRSVISFGLLALFVVSPVVGSNNQQNQKKDRLEIKRSAQEIKKTTDLTKKLSHSIDLWHDANLKGDKSKTAQYAQNLFAVIEQDIVSSSHLAKRYETEVKASVGEYKQDAVENYNQPKERNDLRDDVKDLKIARELTAVKEKLYYAIKHSQSFSNRYRLLNDYLDILKREVGIERQELAEDIGEWHEDKN